MALQRPRIVRDVVAEGFRLRARAQAGAIAFRQDAQKWLTLARVIDARIQRDPTKTNVEILALVLADVEASQAHTDLRVRDVQALQPDDIGHARHFHWPASDSPLRMEGYPKRLLTMVETQVTRLIPLVERNPEWAIELTPWDLLRELGFRRQRPREDPPFDAHDHIRALERAKKQVDAEVQGPL